MSYVLTMEDDVMENLEIKEKSYDGKLNSKKKCTWKKCLCYTLIVFLSLVVLGYLAIVAINLWIAKAKMIGLVDGSL